MFLSCCFNTSCSLKNPNKDLYDDPSGLNNTLLEKDPDKTIVDYSAKEVLYIVNTEFSKAPIFYTETSGDVAAGAYNQKIKSRRWKTNDEIVLETLSTSSLVKVGEQDYFKDGTVISREADKISSLNSVTWETDYAKSDYEGYKKKYGMPSNQTLRDICTAEGEIFENAGYYAMVYASSSWWKNQLAGLTRFDKWVAHWPTSGGKQKGNATSPDGENANNCGIWQFTSQGTLNGYNGNLDMNYAYKDFVLNGMDPNQIIAIIASQIRLLFQVKRLYNSGKSNDEIAKILEFKSVYRVKYLISDSYYYSEDTLIKYLSKLSNIDRDIKINNIDGNILLELFIASKDY